MATQPGRENQRCRRAEQIWLRYFNDYLFERGLITADERNAMDSGIATRDGGNWH